MVCTWTSQGAMECYKQVGPPNRNHKPKLNNTKETFVGGFAYSFNVFLYNSKDNLISKNMYAHVSPSVDPMILQKKPTNYDLYGDDMKLVITDVTLYNNFGSDFRPLPLQLLIEVDKNSKPIPVVFSDKPALDNVHYRTAEINLNSYKGFSLYFDLQRI